MVTELYEKSFAFPDQIFLSLRVKIRFVLPVYGPQKGSSGDIYIPSLSAAVNAASGGQQV